MRSEIERGLERHAHACYSPVASVRGRNAGLEHPVPITGLGRQARIICFSPSRLARVTSRHELAGACKSKPSDVGRSGLHCDPDTGPNLALRSHRGCDGVFCVASKPCLDQDGLAEALNWRSGLPGISQRRPTLEG